MDTGPTLCEFPLMDHRGFTDLLLRFAARGVRSLLAIFGAGLLCAGLAHFVPEVGRSLLVAFRGDGTARGSTTGIDWPASGTELASIAAAGAGRACDGGAGRGDRVIAQRFATYVTAAPTQSPDRGERSMRAARSAGSEKTVTAPSATSSSGPSPPHVRPMHGMPRRAAARTSHTESPT
jgi:hypothetical protein